MPVRLFAAVVVIAAVTGIGRTAARSSSHARTIRIATATPYRPSLGGHRMVEVTADTTTTSPPTPSTSSTTSPPAAAPPAPPTTGAPAATPAAARLTGYGCGAALAWLSGHAAPGFTFLCPGDAHGHQAMTCVNVAGYCPGQRIIAIADPCPAAYMNEAHNSWVLTGLASGSLDPYGSCG
ncbi:MAG TPA: hypothetical protein VFH58_11890 [Acidimicrobiales bacterium]|nr:hypothetical protein [Acidimicrobiales bacterium]